MKDSKKQKITDLPLEWQRLIVAGLKIKRGSVEVVFNEGRPVQINNIVQKIKLTIDEDVDLL